MLEFIGKIKNCIGKDLKNQVDYIIEKKRKIKKIEKKKLKNYQEVLKENYL